MATRLRTHLRSAWGQTRFEPTPKRVRGYVGGELVVDSRDVVLVWEPRRILCEYAVPAEDLAGWRVSQDPGTRQDAPPGDGPIMPWEPFAAHTADGEALDLVVGDRVVAPGAGWRVSEDPLTARVVLDFAALDRWSEEDEDVLGHPRDPFHRVDVRRSSDTVVVRHGDVELARSSRPSVLFETDFPARYYLPAEDVRTDLLTPTSSSSVCAYKGIASYLAHGDVPDVAWGYPDPLSDAEPVRGLWCFDDDKVQVEVLPGD